MTRTYSQSVLSPLGLFDRPRISAILAYFPEEKNVASNLSLFQKWCVVSNSNNRKNPITAWVTHQNISDNKPILLRASSGWAGDWENENISGCQSFTLTKQTSRPYHFKFFKGCLPQILLGSFLNTLSHMLPCILLVILLKIFS